MSTQSNHLWEGSGDVSKLAIDYTAGEDIILDKRLVQYDVSVLKAHVTMLAKKGLVKEKDALKIIDTLDEISAIDKKGEFVMKVELEDVHSNIESYILEKLGIEIGGNVRLAVARNDQVYTDLRLYYKDVIGVMIKKLKKLSDTLCAVAEKHSATIMPGYTHMKVSQPITYGFWVMAKAYHFLDDAKNLVYDLEQIDTCPLGIFEMSGTHAPIDRKMTSDLLGFSGPTENSLYTANQRGEIELKLMADMSLAAIHIKRLMHEMIVFSTHEFGFVKIADKYTTGGTAQPNLKNPDTLEVIRANCAKIMGSHTTLMCMMDSLMSGYNRDTQETKGVMFKAIDIILPTLDLVKDIMKTAELDTEKMEEVAAVNFSNAPDYTIQLAMTSGLSFRESYKIVKHIIQKEMVKDSLSEVDEMMLSDVAKKLLGKDIKVKMEGFEKLDGAKAALARTSYGGSAPKEVLRMIADVKSKVDKI